ncbi:hypothetical protein RLOatenuis_3170 [Rickettsiales bacterium]|nr:hypothetical protein RLOatenuis_3170 [Rickettsiales bacterium]
MKNITEVENKSVSCDGGELGHPRIYLEMGAESEIICPYCNRKFIYVETHKKTK